MSAWFPPPIFNLLTDMERVPHAQSALFAGPLGLIAYILAIPFVLLIGRRWPRTAIALTSLAWLFATLRIPGALLLLGGIAAALIWLIALTALRRRRLLSERSMIVLVWLGLHALIFPLWWRSNWSDWYPTPMQVMHMVGFAYFLLRFIGWGVDLARAPHSPIRLRDSIVWLLYPPIMRLGPLLPREVFFERLANWNPRTSPNFLAGAKRAALCGIGYGLLVVVTLAMPHTLRSGPTFFVAPELYDTSALLRAVYLGPIQIYLILWSYNELAAAISCWIGIRVDNNFNWLPLATSVRDFWRRWHITVGASLRRYIYIPLGGNHSPALLTYSAVFLYCGAWHGPSLSFLVWGASQSLALVAQKLWDTYWRIDEHNEPPRPRWSVVVGWLLTLQYQFITIFIFFDFNFAGARLLPELIRRLVPWG